MCLFTISGGFNLLIDDALSRPGLFWIGWGFRSLSCVLWKEMMKMTTTTIVISLIDYYLSVYKYPQRQKKWVKILKEWQYIYINSNNSGDTKSSTADFTIALHANWTLACITPWRVLANSVTWIPFSALIDVCHPRTNNENF